MATPAYKLKESPEQRADAEQTIQRNPHGNFAEVQASRPDFDHSNDGFKYTKTVAPEWQLGQGANDGGESLKKKHIQIDPYEEGRPAVFNYKLMISAIIPRPIGFVSTRSKDGMCLWRNYAVLLQFLAATPAPVLATYGLGVVLNHVSLRQEHKPCALQLHTDVQPRPADILHWLLRRL